MEKPKGTQGFASMNPKQQKLIASKGGINAHKKGTAHQWTHEETVAAGRKGGLTKAKKKQLTPSHLDLPRPDSPE
jgi:general stress protein YciG